MADLFDKIHSETQGAPPGGGDLFDRIHAQNQPGFLSRLATGAYKSTVGPIMDAVTHPGEALKSLADVPAMEEIAKHISEGNYGHAAAAIGKYAAEKLPGSRQIMQGIQTAEPVVQDVKEGNLAGAGGRVLGTAAMAAAPEILGRAGAALADTKVGAGLKGAVTAAAPDLASGAGMIAGGEALAQVPGMAYPAHIAMAYPAAKLIKSGLVKGSKGWKAAVDARATEIAARANEAKLAADAAKIPPDVMAELTRDSGAPEAATETPSNSVAPEPAPGQPIPGRAPAWEDAAALERLKQAQATAQSAPQTATLEQLAASAPQQPQVQTQAAAAGAGTSSLAEQLQAMMKESGTLPKEEPVPFNPPEFSAETRIASARNARVQQFQKAITDADIPYSDAKLMDTEDWGSVAKKLGIDPPSKATISQTLFELKKSEPQAATPIRTRRTK